MTRRRALILGGAIVMLVVAWIGTRALLARHHLLKARAEVEQLQLALTEGRLGDLPLRLAAAQHEAHAARGLTSDPLWSVLGHLPWMGASFHAAHQVTDAVDAVATKVLPPLVRATDTIAPRSLRQPDGTLQLSRLVKAMPDLKTSMAQLASARGQLGSTGGVVDVMANAQRTLARSLRGLAGSLDTAYRAARIAPEMVGADGPRRYLMIFQTPAESRGTGGLAGSYAIVRFDQGKITTERSGSDSELRNASAPVVDLGRDFQDRYGLAGSAMDWTAANWTPHFPWAAEIWAKLWQHQSGQRVDGVIAVDPIALGYLLSVTGPVTLSDGEVISSANAARWSMSDSYRIFANDKLRRKRLSVELSKKTLNHLSSHQTNLTSLLKVMGKAAGERRLLLWSAHPSEQAVISGTPPAGELSAAAGPFADLILRNGDGNKLDYYLDRSLDYRTLSCTAKARTVQISFTLTNTAPKSGLPSYVTFRNDGRVVPVGQDRVYADLFLADGAVLKSWSLDGKPIVARLSIERGHSVVEYDLELPPGQARTITARVVEPPSSRPVVIPVQPLARPMHVTSSSAC